MRKARYALGLALLVAASLYLLPALRAADEPALDSPEVSELLTQAKEHAVKLAGDAAVMKSFGLTSMSWESHADQINTIRDHVNNLGEVLQKMGERRQFASPWQQNAIDRITPLAAELASNIETTIDHINKNQDRLHTPQYREYLDTNYDVSTSLSGLISDFVSYGKNKAKFDVLGTELEAPGR